MAYPLSVPADMNPNDPDSYDCSGVGLQKGLAEQGAPLIRLHYDIGNVLNGTCSMQMLLPHGAVQARNMAVYLQEKYGSRYGFSITQLDAQDVFISGQSQAHQDTATLSHFLDYFQNLAAVPIHVYGYNGTCRAQQEYIDKVNAKFDEYEELLDQGKRQLQFNKTANPVARTLIATQLTRSIMRKENLLDKQLEQRLIQLSTDIERQLYYNGDNSDNSDFLKMGAGRLINQILERAETGESPQFQVYLVNDHTLGALAAMLSWYRPVPAPGDFMEIRVLNGTRAEVDYKGERQVLLCCGQVQCSLSSFIKHLQEYSLTEQQWSNLCA